MFCEQCGRFLTGNSCTICSTSKKSAKTFEEFREMKGKSNVTERKQDSRLVDETTIFASPHPPDILNIHTQSQQTTLE